MEIFMELLTYLGANFGWVDTVLTVLALAVTLATVIVGLTKPREGSLGAKLIKILNYISVVNPKNVVVVPKVKDDAGQTDQPA